MDHIYGIENSARRRRRWIGRLAGFGAMTLFALSATIGMAAADGTETLGPPSAPMADASNLIIGGVGLLRQPGTLTVDVPADATVRQVLLYWEIGAKDGENGVVPDDTIVVDGNEVTGTLIGGPTQFYGDIYSTTHRADVTALNLVAPGSNSMVVSGIDDAGVHDGAGIVVLFDQPGQPASLTIRDGNDIAFVDFAAPLDTTNKQVFEFAATDEDRTVSLCMFVGSVLDNRPRPQQLHIITGGVETVVADPFRNVDGAEFDHFLQEFVIPAGATTVEAWITSARDGSGNLPASLVWIYTALRIPEPVETAVADAVVTIPTTTTTTIPVVVKSEVLTKTLPFTGARTDVALVGILSLAAGIALTGVSVGLRVAEAQVQGGSHRRRR